MENVLLRLPSGELFRCDPDRISRAYWDGGDFYVRQDGNNGVNVFCGEDAKVLSDYLARLGTDVGGRPQATEQEQEMERLLRDRSRLLQQSTKYCSQLAAIREWLDKEGVPAHIGTGRLTLLERIEALNKHLRSRVETAMNLRKQLEQSQNEHLALAKEVGGLLKYLTGQSVPFLGPFGRELTLLERVKWLIELIRGRREEDDKLVKAFRAYQKWAGKQIIATRLNICRNLTGEIRVYGTAQIVMFFCDLDDLIRQLEKD